MIKGIDVNQRIEFSSVNDTDEVKTMFIFRPLTSGEMMNLVTDGEGNQVQLTGPKLFEFLAMAIVEIKNYSNSKDSIIETLKTLPMTVLTELIKESTRINNVTGADQKNS